MAVCNIFNTFESDKNIGIFLTFSQYMEDLTSYVTKGNNYRVVPSKFVALDIKGSQDAGRDLSNDIIPKILQNHFENGCALWRDEDWNPESSKYLFWNAMIDSELLSHDDNICSAIKFIGDINISSYDEVDGMGYSEIYCHIPNESKEGLYRLDILNDGKSIESSDYILGYTEEELGEHGKLDPHITYTIKECTIEKERDIESNYFNINSIVVLYDIYSGDNTQPIWKDIPMGIYFTGPVVDGNISNSITKYVTNESIYGAGTSYGLRICSRFSLNSNDINISVDGSDYHSNISVLLSEMSKSQSKMDDIINKTYDISQNYKDLLAIFKNSRTNVPYIKNINGINYWFVNGRMLDKSVIDDSKYDGYDLMVSIPDNIILLTDSNNKFNRHITWSIKHGDINVKPLELFLNDINNPQNTSIDYIPIEFDKSNDYQIKGYTVIANIRTSSGIEKIEEDTYVSFVWPSYWGLVNESANDININDIIDQLSVEKIDSRLLVKKYDNLFNDGIYKHVCFAYPSDFGKLTSITDSRDIEYINDFDCLEQTISYNGREIPYYVYIDKHPAGVQNYTLKFR